MKTKAVIILASVPVVKHGGTIGPCRFQRSLEQKRTFKDTVSEPLFFFFFFSLVISDPLPLSMRAWVCCHCSLMILARPRFSFSKSVTLCVLDYEQNKTGFVAKQRLMTALLMKATKRGQRQSMAKICKHNPGQNLRLRFYLLKNQSDLGIGTPTCWGIFPLRAEY